jgi:hypothetical protein
VNAAGIGNVATTMGKAKTPKKGDAPPAKAKAGSGGGKGGGKGASAGGKGAASERSSPKDGAAQAAEESAPRSARTGCLTLPDRLLLDLPHLTDIQRTAFRGQFSHALCDELGARTKAEEVHQEALSWASVINATLRAHPHAVRRYSLARFAWLLECLRDLGAALEEQRAAQGGAGASRHRAERVKATAEAVRGEILLVLSTLAGGDPVESKKLDEATGTAETPEAIARSLGALADLAESWQERPTDAAKALVASVDLSPCDVEAARAAAAALTATVAEKPQGGGGGRSSAQDLPTVNRAEGRVLLEMRIAMRFFERAHRENRIVPRLVPGPATRAVLAPRG